MKTHPAGRVATPPHAVLPLGVQMQLRRAAINGDLPGIDAITDSLAKLGLVRPRGACEWMTRAEILGTLQGPRAR
jgi:hypothetical protein